MMYLQDFIDCPLILVLGIEESDCGIDSEVVGIIYKGQLMNSCRPVMQGSV